MGKGWGKVNSDASFQAQGNAGATACVERDHRGEFGAARACWSDRALNVRMMEATACRDGLLLARQVGVQKAVLETDCLELVNLWKQKDSQRSIVDPVRKEI